LGCKACGHEYERHLFGGACFYCDCKRAVYDTSPVGLRTAQQGEQADHAANGADPAPPKRKRARRPRLGSH
jgi:hypothetical protein